MKRQMMGRWRGVLLVAAAGCSRGGENASLSLSDGLSEVVTPISLDDASATGFSADEVLDAFGAEREYQVSWYGAGDPLDPDENLYAPFTVAIDPTTATAEYVESYAYGTLVSDSLRLEVTLTVTSAAGDIDVTGRSFLGAGAASADAMGWYGQDLYTGEVRLLTGTLPSWASDRAEAIVDEAGCADDATDPPEMGVSITDGLEEPTLRVGLWRDLDDQCPQGHWVQIDAAGLVP